MTWRATTAGPYFLAATAEGYKRAGADPKAAADILVKLAVTENNGHVVDPALALASAEFLKDRFLDKDTGRWVRHLTACYGVPVHIRLLLLRRLRPSII